DGPGGDHGGGHDSGDGLDADCAADDPEATGGAARGARTGSDRSRARSDGAGAADTAGRASGTGRAGAAAPEAELGGQEGLQGDQWANRRQCGECLGVGAHLATELAALLAVANVPAGRSGDAPQPLGGLGQLELDLAACEPARL